MDVNVIKELTLPIIVVGCLALGYVLKNYVPLNNKHIPLLMALCGIGLNVVVNGYISFRDTIVSGALSGIVSLGLQHLFTNYINKTSDHEDERDE